MIAVRGIPVNRDGFLTQRAKYEGLKCLLRDTGAFGSFTWPQGHLSGGSFENPEFDEVS